MLRHFLTKKCIQNLLEEIPTKSKHACDREGGPGPGSGPLFGSFFGLISRAWNELKKRTYADFFNVAIRQPALSLPHFKCLTFLEFRVFWVPLWYPEIIMFKTMTPKLSNAVLHVPLWSLSEIWHPCEDWRFLHKFQWKVIFF